MEGGKGREIKLELKLRKREENKLVGEEEEEGRGIERDRKIDECGKRKRAREMIVRHRRGRVRRERRDMSVGRRRKGKDK